MASSVSAGYTRNLTSSDAQNNALDRRGHEGAPPASPSCAATCRPRCGTCAALGHPAVVDHLVRLGVTAVELLPIHAFVDDRFLAREEPAQLLGLLDARLLRVGAALPRRGRRARAQVGDPGAALQIYDDASASSLLRHLRFENGGSKLDGKIIQADARRSRIFRRINSSYEMSTVLETPIFGDQDGAFESFVLVVSEPLLDFSVWNGWFLRITHNKKPLRRSIEGCRSDSAIYVVQVVLVEAHDMSKTRAPAKPLAVFSPHLPESMCPPRASAQPALPASRPAEGAPARRRSRRAAPRRRVGRRWPAPRA